MTGFALTAVAIFAIDRSATRWSAGGRVFVAGTLMNIAVMLPARLPPLSDAGRATGVR